MGKSSSEKELFYSLMWVMMELAPFFRKASEIVLLVNQDIPREASPLHSLYHLCNGGSEGGKRKRAWNGAEKNKIKKKRERRPELN